MKVLVVDDDVRIRRLYRMELEEAGFQVATAGSGTEAIEKFEAERPQVVTLDILMPDMDGLEVLRALKRRNASTPVIISTAFDYRNDFGVWASDAYLVKSSDLSELKSTIEALAARDGKA